MRSLDVFTVTLETLEDACVIRATGELDASTRERLRGPLEGARTDGVTVLLDLSGVTFVDSSGLRVLLEAARAAREGGDWAWFLVRPSPAILRLVELTGTASRLPLVAPQDAGARYGDTAAGRRSSKATAASTTSPAGTPRRQRWWPSGQTLL